MAILYAATKGALDDMPTHRVKDWETGFYRFLETERPKILDGAGRERAPSAMTSQPPSTRRSSVYRESFLA